LIDRSLRAIMNGAATGRAVFLLWPWMAGMPEMQEQLPALD